MKSLIVTFFLFTIYFLLTNCSENSTKPPPPIIEQRDTITISIEQTTHRSISLYLNHKLQLPKDQYVLNRIEGSDTSTFLLLSPDFSDTVIIDDNTGVGLTIDTEYSYFAYRLDSLNQPKDTSNVVTARTLPPTSHDFTWTEYIIGDGGELRDVWGMDENNVFATGYININDTIYGNVHWDGTKWTPIGGAGGNVIFGFTNDDIWELGNDVSYFDGNSWQSKAGKWIDGKFIVLDEVLASNGPYYAVWGTSSDNMYFGSGQGTTLCTGTGRKAAWKMFWKKTWYSEIYMDFQKKPYTPLHPTHLSTSEHYTFLMATPGQK